MLRAYKYRIDPSDEQRIMFAQFFGCCRLVYNWALDVRKEAYEKDKSFVRLDIPYPMQHFITLPNIERMSYTSAFVGQVSEIQMPYNDGKTGGENDLGVVSYYDFTK